MTAVITCAKCALHISNVRRPDIGYAPFRRCERKDSGDLPAVNDPACKGFIPALTEEQLSGASIRRPRRRIYNEHQN